MTKCALLGFKWVNCTRFQFTHLNHQVSQGLVQLGFSLLESGGGPKGEMYANLCAVELASVILPLILKKQPHIAHVVISQLSNCILSAASPLQYVGE